MSLYNILRKVRSDSGMNSPLLNVEQNAQLIDKINEAADEIYSMKDLPVTLQEVYVRATNDQRISLPPFVGEIRAIRSVEYDNQWTLHDLRPRYNSLDWPNKWNKARIIGEFPTKDEEENIAPGTINYPVVDATLTVTIVGETANSNRGIDSIIQTGVSTVWIKTFTAIRAIRKNKITDYNVVINNADGEEIAVIYADQLESRYLVLDISMYPNIQTCDDGIIVFEVLFKPRLNRMENDEDSFPVSGYDDIIALRTKQLLLEDQEGKEAQAILKYEKSKVRLKEKTEDKVGTTEHMLQFAPNPILNIFRRRRYW